MSEDGCPTPASDGKDGSTSLSFVDVTDDTSDNGSSGSSYWDLTGDDYQYVHSEQKQGIMEMLNTAGRHLLDLEQRLRVVENDVQRTMDLYVEEKQHQQAEEKQHQQAEEEQQQQVVNCIIG